MRIHQEIGKRLAVVGHARPEDPSAAMGSMYGSTWPRTRRDFNGAQVWRALPDDRPGSHGKAWQAVRWVFTHIRLVRAAHAVRVVLRGFNCIYLFTGNYSMLKNTV